MVVMNIVFHPEQRFSFSFFFGNWRLIMNDTNDKNLATETSLLQRSEEYHLNDFQKKYSQSIILAALLE